MAGRVVVPVEPGFSAVFRSRNGVVGRDLERRALLIQVRAIRQAGMLYNRLRPSIKKEWVNSGRADRLTMRVGSNVRHALVHHEGARPHFIRARNARVLRYVNKRGQVVFANAVGHPGHPANKYLSDQLPAAVR